MIGINLSLIWVIKGSQGQTRQMGMALTAGTAVTPTGTGCAQSLRGFGGKMGWYLDAGWILSACVRKRTTSGLGLACQHFKLTFPPCSFFIFCYFVIMIFLFAFTVFLPPHSKKDESWELICSGQWALLCSIWSKRQLCAVQEQFFLGSARLEWDEKLDGRAISFFPSCTAISPLPCKKERTSWVRHKSCATTVLSIATGECCAVSVLLRVFLCNYAAEGHRRLETVLWPPTRI